ncbi:MarC family protein [Arsenicicoccus piscis]|uniref:UPF0056 membrane protein n=1 Tax=Arsenicicoccus piscis TaxID=673954 RepID=A0ABQ6HVK9_9MICO|nr:MarC family protein [Arsenicicoccus piscis]MCH8627549.1 MarC family protein [Arsenicicoccus piscis]GMA18021.1 UPF0056 inner membrane protein [Arsenicicoccus piscis]GMA21734.1 UPF0056 inner membrane protein [Arsenicicoccus piscis]
MDTALLVKAFGGFFAIMNPFVALPMFLTLTAGYDLKRQRTTALRVALYSTVMGLVIMVSGTAILTFFGVGVNDFRVAGGIVLMSIALGMLHGGSSSHTGTKSEQAQQSKQAAESDVSFYPLTFPMILGPGTITTIIVFAGQAQGVSGNLAVVLSLLVVIALLLLVLWFAPKIGRHLSETLRVMMTRLMGMILAAIAVQMVLAGLMGLIPALRR